MLKDKVAGRRVLLARAAVGRDVIPEELTRAGAEVRVAEAYQTVLPADSIDRIRALFAEGERLPDAATFTSSSTVSNFFRLLHAAGLDLPRGLRAISIGPITTGSLLEHNWEPAREAASSDIRGLVEACERLFEPGA
jgi:uroporphyrinogen-III synthase